MGPNSSFFVWLEGKGLVELLIIIKVCSYKWQKQKSLFSMFQKNSISIFLYFIKEVLFSQKKFPLIFLFVHYFCLIIYKSKTIFKKSVLPGFSQFYTITARKHIKGLGWLKKKKNLSIMEFSGVVLRRLPLRLGVFLRSTCKKTERWTQW